MVKQEINWLRLRQTEVVPVPTGFNGFKSAEIKPITLKIAVVGYGYWGQKLAQALQQQGVTVVIVDPQIEKAVSWQMVLADKTISAVVIATPEVTHAALTVAALAANKAVLVEKPAALTATDWQKMTAVAEQKKLPLFVDQTFLLSRGAHAWSELTEQFASQLGKLQQLTSVRNVQLATEKIITKAIPVWVDSAIHDIYLLRWLWSRQPEQWQVQIHKKIQTFASAAVVASNHAQPKFIGQYDWQAELPERSWTATFDQGVARWEKQLQQDKLTVSTLTGEVLLAMEFSDSDPSPLDQTIALFLAWVTLGRTWNELEQNIWKKYWSGIAQDTAVLEQITLAATATHQQGQ
jgi:predicted dehydrogenase